MKSASLSELQKELVTLESKHLQQICMRLAKYKKENKELLSYLLFDINDEKTYIENAKRQIDELLYGINRKTTYTTKKGLQKIVRNMNKIIKISGRVETELDLRIYFCSKVNKSGISLASSAVISNLYDREKDKIQKNLSNLHEDLQFDYKDQIQEL